MTTDPKLSGGTIFGFGLPSPWPPEKPGVLQDVFLKSSMFRCILQPDCRATIQLFKIENGDKLVFVSELSTCGLDGEAGSLAIISVQTDNSGQLQLRLDGRSTGTPDSDLPPDTSYTLNQPTKPLEDIAIPTGIAQDARDARLEAESQYEARKKKGIERGKLDRKTKPGPNFDFANLRRNTNNLERSVARFDETPQDASIEAAALLRMLLADKPLGGLQRCALHLDANLRVYDQKETDIERPAILDEMQVYENFAATERDAVRSEPVDLDDWLSKTAYSSPGMELTHAQVIKAVGDTLGNHSDPELHPFLERAGFIDADGDIQLGPVTNILRSYAVIALALSQELQQARNES